MLVSSSSFKNSGLGDEHLTDISPEQVSDIVSILRGEKRKDPQLKPSTLASLTAVLPTHRTRILGIIGVSPISFSAADLKRLLPEIDWGTHLRYFRRRNLIELKDGKYHIPAETKRLFLRSSEDKLPYLQEWIAALEPLKRHPDTALFLGVLQVLAGQLVESICTLVDAAEALHRGHWNDTYLSSLLNVDTPVVLRLLTNEQRACYFNSVALCLLRAGRHEESVKWFLRLRRFRKRVRNNWGIGQSYHNCGIVYIESGDLSKAADCFRKAIKHTRKTRNKFLLGRSLYELAITLSVTSSHEAAKLLSESEKVKKQIGDEVGLIGVKHGYGVLAVQRGEYQEAIRWFTKAERIAHNTGDYHFQALERYNIGKAHIDLRKYQEALPYLRQARKMAEEDELADVLMLAVGGEALTYEKQGKNHLAENAFRKLFELHSGSGNDIDAVIALHDVGVLLMRQSKYKEARKIFSRAAQLARRKNVSDWAYQCQADIAKCHVAEGRVGKAISTLRRMAASEERRGVYDVAAKLWSDVISYSTENNIAGAKIIEAVERCIKSAEKAEDAAALKVPVYANLHRWYWENQDYKAGLKTLEDVLECAESAGDDETVFCAQDQIGACLQELDRYPEAIKSHRKALRIARRLENLEFLEISLNNLGEALRETRRYAEAIRVLEEAEGISRNRGDHESAISVAHNRALTLQHQGKFDDAENVFRQCRDGARKRKLWSEYVRALHALANIAWHRGNSDIAVKRYKKALRAADKYNAKSRYHICLNYANALSSLKQPESAIEILASATSQFELVLNAHQYHSDLADLYEETGNTKLAVKHWELAYESAIRVNNDYWISYSACALAAIHEDHEDVEPLEKANQYYQSAFEHETDSELRAPLLLRRARVLLKLNKEKEASKVLDEFHSLPADQKSQKNSVDALLIIGDHNWMKNKSQKEALQFYFAAMMACSNTDIERFFEIGVMIATRLSHIETRDKKRRVADLKRTIIRWFEEDQGVELEKQIALLLLWPFTVATRLVNAVGSNTELTESEFSDIIQDEINKAFT